MTITSDMFAFNKSGDSILVPIFSARDKDSNEIVEGFYFNYPLTNAPQQGSDIVSNVAHCLLTYKPGMMGIINEPMGCTIDMTTLQFVRYISVPCTGPLKS